MSTARELGERIKALVRSGDSWLFNGGKGEHSRDVVLRLIDQLVSLAQPGEGALTDEQLWDMRSAAKSDQRTVGEHWFILFARAVEAHHGIGSKK